MIKEVSKVVNPLRALISQKPVFNRHIEVEEFEEKAEEP